MRLTKTEIMLLEKLKTTPTIGVECYSGQGGEGGPVKLGVREFAAGQSLINKKLAVQVGEIHRTPHYKNGFCIHTTSLSLRLP